MSLIGFDNIFLSNCYFSNPINWGAGFYTPFYGSTMPSVNYNSSLELCGNLFEELKNNYNSNAFINPCSQSIFTNDYSSNFFGINPAPSYDIWPSAYAMPQYTYTTLPSLLSLTSQTGTYPKTSGKTSSISNYKFNTTIKYDSLKAAGYNAGLAKRLAMDAASHVESSSTGYCSKYVSNSLERLGIVGERGDAWELRSSLRKNPHFKEIAANSVDVNNLPAGCILVYQRGDAGYSQKYGHVEITLGDGTAASDFINKNLKNSSNMSIFVPVSA